MVKLLDNYVDNLQAFKKAGIKVPEYDAKKTTVAGQENPTWVHFGGGNLFRCFHAAIAQKLLNQNKLEAGVVVAETYDEAVIKQIYQKYQNRFLKVVLNPDGTLEKELINSVAESIYFNRDNPDGWNRLTEIFEQPTLQLATFSITEKGYSLTDMNGDLSKSALEDIKNGPQNPATNMGAITYLLYARYQKNRAPIAMVSTDNFSQNGLKLQKAVMTIANGWLANGSIDKGFIEYLSDVTKVSFPWSMIDRITPNPADKVGELLRETGFEDTEILHTAKHTNIAPFGNTESTHYLVIEDSFPNGRPPLEDAGVILTDRETVNDADQMKVTACLNPLHTALAIFGCLLGYHSISEEVGDEDLSELIKKLGYQEDLPVVKDPKVIDPESFLQELLTKRLPNPNIPDTPQRIASDTSQKMAIRYGVTLQQYVAKGKDINQLQAIPLIIAAWCRYLLAIDDKGESFKPSPDPMLDILQTELSGIQFNSSKTEIHEALQSILSNKQIFGIDLYEIGLGEKVESLFAEMLTGTGAVRKTLHQVIIQN